MPYKAEAAFRYLPLRNLFLVDFSKLFVIISLFHTFDNDVLAVRILLKDISTVYVICKSRIKLIYFFHI